MKRVKRVSMVSQVVLGWSVGVYDWVRSCLHWGLLSLVFVGLPGLVRAAEPPAWLDQARFDRLLEEAPLSPEEEADFADAVQTPEAPLSPADAGVPLGDSPLDVQDPASRPAKGSEASSAKERPGVFERGPHHQKVRQKVDRKSLEKGRKDRLKALEKEIKDFEKKHREVVKSMDAPTMPDPLSSEQRAWMALITEEEDLKAEIKALKGKGKGEEELEEYTELASGLHYWSPSKKKWRRSKAKIELVDGIGVARQGQQRVLFAPDLSAEGSIDISTSDGKRLKATVLGLAYVDVTTGEDAIIATVQSTVGEIVGENQIVYVDAFQGIEADVVYTYEEVGLEQDVILKSQIPGPEAFGMDPEKVRLEVLTEFYDAPLVEKRAQVLRDASEDASGAELEPALVDEGLSFGSVEIAMGSAFWRQSESDKDQGKKKGKKDKDASEERPIGPNGLPAGLEHELPRLKYPVAKHWLEQGGRTILCEGVRFAAVSDMLAELPQPKKERADLPARFPAQGRIAASARSGGRQIPQLHPASALDEQIAKIQYAKPETLLAMASPGFVMDYQTLNTVPAYTFEAGRTYLIQSDMVIRGTTLIEGGTIIKYARSTGARTVQLRCLGSVVCDTEPYRPAIFTAKDDHQYGVSFWSNSPVSGYYPLRAIWIEPSGEPVTIEHVRIKYATNGLFFENSRGAKLRHSQIIGCRHPVATRHQDLEVENVLIDDFGKYAFWAMHSWPPETILPGQEVNIHASHVTVSNGPWLAWNSHWDGHMGTTEFKNSLLVNVNGGYVDGSFYPGDIGDIFIHSPFLPNVPHTSVFATQNLGRFYLPPGSPYRDAGQAPVDPLLALDLRQRTTSAPNLVQGYVSGPMGPFVALDDDGSLDLGYHYARIDHAIHYAIANSNVTVVPGTVVSCSGSLGIARDAGGCFTLVFLVVAAEENHPSRRARQSRSLRRR